MAEEKLDTFDRFHCRTSNSFSQDQLKNDVSCKVELIVLINPDHANRKDRKTLSKSIV